MSGAALSSLDAEGFMAKAIELARLGEGRTAPNPPVGAVLVRDGRIVGQGYHPAAGLPHAEIFALQDAGDLARGADLYVTLEPCCHQGRTGPCAEALITAGVRRVFFGAVDPNPLVAGQGLDKLRAAGIEVIAAPLADACRRLIAPFAKLVAAGRPYLILKAAMTVDGQLATSSGESRWISGDLSRERVHRLRDRVDGILTGADTVLQDDPQMTTRLPEGGGHNPVRIVLDGQLRTTPRARIFGSDAPGRRLLITGEDISVQRFAPYTSLGVEIVTVPRSGKFLDLAAAMGCLGKLGLQTVLVEGGGVLNGALLRAGLVDRLMLFVAPVLFGGCNGRPLFAGAGAARLADALRLVNFQVSRCGDDLLLEGDLAQCSQD